MVAGETDVAVGDVDGFLDEVGGVLFDGFKDDFHVVDDVVSGDDDGLVEMVVGVFLEEEADVFGFVSGEAFAIDEDAGVEAVRLALKNEGAVGGFVNVGVIFDGFQTFFGDGGFGVVFFKVNVELVVKTVEVGVAELAAAPVGFGEFGVVELFFGDAVDFFVELYDFGFGFLGCFVGAGAFDVAVCDVFDGEVGEVFFLEGVEGFGDMEADVAAEVDAVDGAAGEFDEPGDGFAHDGRVKVADVEDFEGVRVGELGDDDLARIFIT